MRITKHLIFFAVHSYYIENESQDFYCEKIKKFVLYFRRAGTVLLPNAAAVLKGAGMITIRNEEEKDYEKVEKLVRRAFYNVFVPGCFEHYLVHVMRSHADFLPELDFVLEKDGRIIGNIMYTRARVVDENGREKKCLTLGPVCIAPEYQRKGYGRRLINHSLEKAAGLGYEAVVLFGSPANYAGSGFKSCKKYNVCSEEGKYPSAMMVKELVAGVFTGERQVYSCSPVMNVSEEDARLYDDALEPMEKREQPSQEEFYIMSRSFLE